MKILITGTHFTPAQAVIEELVKDEKIKIVYVGRKFTKEGDNSSSVESQVLPKLGIKFIPITSGRIQRSFSRYTIPSILKIPVSIIQSLLILLREKPDVVLSFGGYVAVPVVIIAWTLSIPIIIHEQTLVSGLANSICSIFASKIAVSFQENNLLNQNKTIFTGNPIRKRVLVINPKTINVEMQKMVNYAQKEKLPLILVTGGNQGSHIINQTVRDCLEELSKISCIIHQTGDSEFKDFENLNQEKITLKNSERYIVTKWIDDNDWGFILKNIDMAVSRAGINTLLEFAFFKVPTLAIPIAYLHKNEQVINAKYFEGKGLVTILPQSKLTPLSLVANVKEMINNLTKLKEKVNSLNDIIIPDAANRVALETILLAKKS